MTQSREEWTQLINHDECVVRWLLFWNVSIALVLSIPSCLSCLSRVCPWTALSGSGFRYFPWCSSVNLFSVSPCTYQHVCLRWYFTLLADIVTPRCFAVFCICCCRCCAILPLATWHCPVTNPAIIAAPNDYLQPSILTLFLTNTLLLLLLLINTPSWLALVCVYVGLASHVIFVLNGAQT